MTEYENRIKVIKDRSHNKPLLRNGNKSVREHILKAKQSKTNNKIKKQSNQYLYKLHILAFLFVCFQGIEGNCSNIKINKKN